LVKGRFLKDFLEKLKTLAEHANRDVAVQPNQRPRLTISRQTACFQQDFPGLGKFGAPLAGDNAKCTIQFETMVRSSE
jgi:hypothetical protein